jgi:hypothetical protein
MEAAHVQPGAVARRIQYTHQKSRNFQRNSFTGCDTHTDGRKA